MVLRNIKKNELKKLVKYESNFYIHLLSYKKWYAFLFSLSNKNDMFPEMETIVPSWLYFPILLYLLMEFGDRLLRRFNIKMGEYFYVG